MLHDLKFTVEESTPIRRYGGNKIPVAQQAEETRAKCTKCWNEERPNMQMFPAFLKFKP
jgi:hypothetical protein